MSVGNESIVSIAIRVMGDTVDRTSTVCVVIMPRVMESFFDKWGNIV